MTKTRFTATDVRAMVRDLRSSVLGLRVVNVYDLDAKTYLMKLASPGQEKAVLLLESGVRFHTTKFTHAKSDMPSGFSMKLRKHIRTQRLEDVRQVGMDRVVDFKFGSGEASNHVILELYASGNIILTDYKYEILDLLRTHTYDGQDGTGGDVRVAVRQIYPMDLATTQEGTSPTTEPAEEQENKEAEEEAGAFVNGLPLEEGVQRMGDWLEQAAKSTAVPPQTPLALISGGGDTADQTLSAAAAAAAAAAAVMGGVPSEGKLQSNGGKRKGGGGAKKAKKATLKQALMQKGSGVSVYGPSVLEHCVLGAGLRPNVKLTAEGVEVGSGSGSGGDAGSKRGGLSEDEVRRLVVALGGAEAAVELLDRPGQQGFILCKPVTASGTATGTEKSGGSGKGDASKKKKGVEADVGAKGGGGIRDITEAAGVVKNKEKDEKKEEKKGDDAEADNVVYEEFLPQLLAQHEGSVVHSFPSFDQAVDAFFGRIVEQKLKQTARAAEAAVERKVAWIRQDQERRVVALEERQDNMLRHAQLAEAWADEVEKALMVVRSALANGMDWQALDDLVKAETANGNPIASLIHELRLDTNKVVLCLTTADDDEEQLVEVDIMLSAHANARVMYENKKVARTKELKTLKASEKVLKVAEQQAQKTLQRQAHKRSLGVARKAYWFEKFNWFITSENYLVLSGRDAQQNEVVVKKYLRPGDIYVHADLHGASSCVVRNKDPSGKRPVSPLALEEAGCMTVCRSGAWGAKMVTSAWWVYADQVSKTAPTGEYLVTGSFMVRGRKHFLPPRSLEMGFALLFKLDDSSLAAHVGERREKVSAEDEALLPGGDGGMKGGGNRGNSGNDENASAAAGGGAGDPTNLDRQAVRFDVPVGADDKNNRTDHDGEAAKRRAAALAALAGVGGGEGTARGGSGVNPPLPPWPVGMDERVEGKDAGGGGGGGGGGGEVAAEPSKKRLSAKERKQAKKGGGGTSNSRSSPGPDSTTGPPGNPGQDEEDVAVGDGKSGGGEGRGDQDEEEGDGGRQEKKGGGDAPASTNTNSSVPRGKRSKLKRMKKKYADQDEDDRKLAMEALGKANPEAEIGGSGGRRRNNEGNRKEAAAAEAAAEAAASKNLRKAEAESVAAVAALDETVRARLEELVRPDELDSFEVRALGKFDVVDAMDILDRFGEADLRRVRNRSGFLAGIMRKHGSASSTTATAASGNATADTATVADGSKDAAADQTDQAAEATDSVAEEAQGMEDGAAADVDNGHGNSNDKDDVEEQQEGESPTPDTPAAGHAAAGEDGDTDRDRDAEEGVVAAASPTEGDVADGDKNEGEGDNEGGEPLSRRAQKRQEDEEVRKLLEEEGGGDDLDGESNNASGAASAAAAGATELDWLTGKPREEDVLLFAVPVCGPYMSLRDYKYKVKLTPGKQKRGKASKQAIEIFSRARDTPAGQKALMKGITDNECVAAMIGDVKVSVAGLAQANQAKKKANKQQAQKDPKKAPKQTKPKGKSGKGKK